ncbi:golgin subfamily B member 1 [Poecilia reticulata]|uniref:golgin subfamily B member 1 n=1 Tax=Poecilia reticulata TaxID=8081 RepID=UPI0004A392AC|nr:PREDICTED: golgin subfamily B member 1 [Poecilia reticulata]
MLSRLANVLQELSGEEGADGNQQGVLEPQLPAADGQTAADAEVPEDAMERLAHLEQLVVQLKELIRDKDAQLLQQETELTSKDAQLKNEKEEAEARFTKLKLQAKAKMASLNKQITELKGQAESATPDGSFSSAGASAAEEELQDLRAKLSEEEASSRQLKERLLATELLLQEKEAAHAEQLRALQAVVAEKDARFQEQIQRHEEELLKVGTQDGTELQQAAQQRCVELEETLFSRSQELEMLQQEVSSADQQKQILTAQFRLMEQELTEAVRLRQEWAERARQGDAELSALREAALISQQQLEKEKMEVSRLEAELILMKEAELAAAQAHQDASERDRAEITRLQSEIREAESAREETVEQERLEVDDLQTELANLREEQEGVKKKEELLAEVWSHLRSIAPEAMPEGDPTDPADPTDPSLLLDSVRSVETQLIRLKGECGDLSEQYAQLTQNMEVLQEQLHIKTAEQEEADVKIRQLEQQIVEMSDTETSPDSSQPDKEHILALEQQLVEKDNELVALRESITVATKQSSGEAEMNQSPDQDAAAAPADSVEDTQDEETTLVAEDTSVLSIPADSESSPELIGPQSESPEESKGTSSDEMVTSTDSEVAHSSWTLLEAMNQDGAQEWPSAPQDVGQSWVATSMEQESSQTSSVVQVHLTQQSPSSTDENVNLFAQALAEELQKRYGELLAELQALKDAAAASQERIKTLEEEAQSLTVAKEESEAEAFRLSKELENGKMVEKQSVEMQLLEEELEILKNENKTKEEKIEALQADLETTQKALSEQEGEARMLSAQLEDGELLSSELQKKLHEMENSLLEHSQTSDLHNESLSKKDSEIQELQLLLTQKEKEVAELNDSMSARLLQAEEEKFEMKGEVSKLKEQMEELEKVRDDQQQASNDDEEVVSLRKEKEALEMQLVTTKKKLQAALVQRKELMKKVSEFEKEAERQKEKDETDEPSEKLPHRPEIQDLEDKIMKLEDALRSKEEEVEALKQRLDHQDQVLAETIALNRKLSEEQPEATSETGILQSQVTSLEAECETLQKKFQEAQESRKETIRKAKEKDRHHREQMKQLKDDFNELTERFDVQSSEREGLLDKLRELEKKATSDGDPQPEPAQASAANSWVQEDWVDFAASETDSLKPQASDPDQHPLEPSPVASTQLEESLKALQDEIQDCRQVNTELEKQLQETHSSLSLRESEILELGKDLEALREKEKQIDALYEEMNELREKYLQAEAYTETLKAEIEMASKASAEASMKTLQAEVEDFKQFLDNKNHEISELSQQLSEQNSLIHSMQDSVSEKDQLISSLQEELKGEQEKMHKLQTELPQKQEEDGEAKLQQLQRKLQAALVSRKEALKENKTLKEQLALAEKIVAELQQKIHSTEEELESLRGERAKLIEEVDRTLVENQSLGSSCESLKLVMEGIINEKDACKKEVELAKEEAARVCKEWEEKVQGMKEEYETLLKSYENVSDEAERVRKVLEAARQERQELAAKARAHETARQESERRAEEAQKEVDTVKDKMRKFAKTKQQKIMELEEENERLRERQETSKQDDPVIKVEAEHHQEEMRALQAELEAAARERDALSQQVEELNGQLADMEANQRSSAPVVEEVITSTQSVMTAAEPQDDLAVAEEKEKIQALLEDKLREIEILNAEKELWQKREAELASLEQELQESKNNENRLEKNLQESNERETHLIEDASKREAQLKELLESLETEKDNLEERLMNQLAQLNGSIATYQQEEADNREQLAETQREVERLEAEVQSEKDRAARLEEDVRQARRERAEAEAESGKQRELEQQLRSAQRVKEGSQSRAKQLEELLREKQLEVRQLQRDSIQYQEKISELGREVKALQLSQEELRGRLEQSKMESAKTLEDLKRSEAEMESCKTELAEARKEASEAVSARMATEQSFQQKEAALKAEAEQTLDSVRFRLGAELKETELRLEEAYSEREKEEEAAMEAREVAEAAERRTQETQARLDETLARLAAFSRSMSSLQDDRDRVLDEARQWETRFNSALQGKEAEVREAETRTKELTDQLQKETALKEELEQSVNRLQKAEKDWQLRFEEEQKNVVEHQVVLDQERLKLEETASELVSAQNEVGVLKNMLESLRQRVRALEEAVGRQTGEVERARTELREREAEERRLCLNVEQLETDLRSSKVLTESLQTELQEKERREVELLGEKELAVAQAAEEARKEAESRAQDAERELEQRRGEVRDLEGKLREAQEESSNRKTKLDSFTKAMGSLQDDRDRVLSTYKQLEEKHLQVMMEKDGLIQEAAAENNSLKEELRSLLVQRDDMHAEQAKLSAQLHGYRDNLTQVLSMKDSQHKQLLAAHREKISTLQRERGELEAQLSSKTKEETQKVEMETLSRASQVMDAPGAEVEKLREQLQAERVRAEALEEQLAAESRELAELRWEGGVMRTESESAQERVAELARDLLIVEQRLLEETDTTKQLRQQLADAMAALQQAREEAAQKVREPEERSRAAQSGAGEVWGLKNALQALQNDRERLLEQLNTQTAELKKQKSDLARLGAGELIKVSQELLEEKKKNEEILEAVTRLESAADRSKQETESLRLERTDWLAQAEQLKQQTLATLSEKDQQLRQLAAMLEEARLQKPKLKREQLQRQGTEERDSPPGAPQERSSLADGRSSKAEELLELQQRLEEETQQRLEVEEQLMATQDLLKRHSQASWHSANEGDLSETAVFIEPPEGAVTRTRRGGPSLLRMLRVAFCSRQRTPLLLGLYLLTVHVLLLLCLGGYL